MPTIIKGLSWHRDGNPTPHLYSGESRRHDLSADEWRRLKLWGDSMFRESEVVLYASRGQDAPGSWTAYRANGFVEDVPASEVQTRGMLELLASSYRVVFVLPSRVSGAEPESLNDSPMSTQVGHRVVLRLDGDAPPVDVLVRNWKE